MSVRTLIGALTVGVAVTSACGTVGPSVEPTVPAEPTIATPTTVAVGECPAPLSPGAVSSPGPYAIEGELRSTELLVMSSRIDPRPTYEIPGGPMGEGITVAPFAIHPDGVLFDRIGLTSTELVGYVLDCVRQRGLGSESTLLVGLQASFTTAAPAIREPLRVTFVAEVGDGSFTYVGAFAAEVTAAVIGLAERHEVTPVDLIHQWADELVEDRGGIGIEYERWLRPPPEPTLEERWATTPPATRNMMLDAIPPRFRGDYEAIGIEMTVDPAVVADPASTAATVVLRSVDGVQMFGLGVSAATIALRVPGETLSIEVQLGTRSFAFGPLDVPAGQNALLHVTRSDDDQLIVEQTGTRSPTDLELQLAAAFGVAADGTIVASATGSPDGSAAAVPPDSAMGARPTTSRRFRAHRPR